MPGKLKQSKGREKKGFKGLNYLHSSALLMVIEDYNKIINHFRDTYYLKYESIELINCMFFNYNRTCTGISINALVKLCPTQSWYSAKGKLLRLEKKGLVRRYLGPIGFDVFEPTYIVTSFFDRFSAECLGYMSQKSA